MALRRALLSNIIPALALWGFAFALLYLYRVHAPTQNALLQLAEMKTRFGYGFSMTAQALAAGLLPFLFQRFQKGDHRRIALAVLPFLMLVRAVMGAMTDLFYTLQSQWFSEAATPQIVAIKTLVDMAIYTPFIVIPLLVWSFALMDNEFSLQKSRAALGKNWIKDRALPVYWSALAVWVPTLAVLYSLPLALQFPFQAIVQCFFSLILVVITSE